ncbi:MAG: N-acetylmuramoyl-L-alanine amidase [Rhodobacter sp.]|uniref:N-acetylmuramoyl-L-alanine amidase n=1 Tax=Pararhodobacter sp. TaxID=2127056 RepID=UPI001D8A2F90|nr:N-acetylmuramoyl-L-alanine amidase [Pararhodobacter sp.]MCB1343869.1 N-acetylmuramoyl-L-alanine amidase [Paracoccaceae bacterium]MCC0073320.1 N-acetylmuramoyl-L-alanine amidase [Rhodobacter sp.]HPD91209.1 N-acetylmuramoyl-L-alanine amidase [Pararhodobacter sp.]
MIRHPSPNAGPRRDGLRPELVVLHFTEMASAEAALQRLCDPAAEVSAHYLIARDGRLWQMVDEGARAWHAGAGAWRGRDDVNSRSIGIELDNDGRSPFPHPLMARLETLLPGILSRWSIPARGVIAHSDMAPQRKSDPGPRFDWRRLARQGLAIWPETAGDADAPLAASLDRIGYPPAPADLRLRAFRLRFRPGHAGPEDGRDRALADALARLSDD